MQTWYGKAIRDNTDSGVYAMKKAIGAILHHCCHLDNEEKRHMFGSPGKSSWCRYQRVVAKIQRNQPKSISQNGRFPY